MLRALAGRYFNTWWIPVVCCILISALLVLSLHPAGRLIERLSMFLFLGSIASLLGIIVSALYALAKKEWGRGAFQLLSIGVLFFAVRHAIFLAIFASMFGPSDDGFADNLVIPDGIEISEPLEENPDRGDEEPDTFQLAIRKSVETKGSEDATVTAQLPVLTKLQKDHPDILRRYLSTSIAWRVFTEHDKLFATRRWVGRGSWEFSLHGYYSGSSTSNVETAVSDFQTRLTLGFSGQPWWSNPSNDATDLKMGQPVVVKISDADRNRSLSLVETNGLIVEVYEQSPTKERCITKASLAFLDNELAPLAASPSWETIQKIVPPASIVDGEPSLELRNGSQPGIYNSNIRVNPGEPGRIYLRAYEITKGTRLSEGDLDERSNEYVGWSDNPRQQFFSNANFTIYEGDWGKPYAARFELWFIPDSRKPERKLLEKNFKIEGWQR